MMRIRHVRVLIARDVYSVVETSAPISEVLPISAHADRYLPVNLHPKRSELAVFIF